MKLPIALLFTFATVLFMSCGESPQSKKARTEHEHLNKGVNHTGPEYTSKYICPMHCTGSGSDSTGICPTCKMDYVLNESDKD